MESLQKTSKKYLFLSFTMLMEAMLVVSCKCENTAGGRGRNEERVTAAIELAFDNPQLKSMDERAVLNIKAIQSIKMKGLKLVAKLTSNSAPAGTVKLDLGNRFYTAELGKEFEVSLASLVNLKEEDILPDGSIRIVFVTIHSNKEQNVTLAVEVKNSQGELIGSSKAVEWTEPLVQLHVVSDKPLIVDQEMATITVTNKSEIAIRPSNIKIISITDQVTFKAGPVQFRGGYDELYLREVLGNDHAINPNEQVKFTIGATSNNGGDTKCMLTLEMRHNSRNVFARTKILDWEESEVRLVVQSDKTEIQGKEVATISVTNNSALTLMPADLRVAYGVGNKDVAFTLGSIKAINETADIDALDDIINNNHPIAAGETVTFTFQVEDSGGSDELTLKLGIKRKTAVLFKETGIVGWKK